ncbi:MAG: Y-family DNA polymerase [Candidatus Bilamarchaeum sp.]
MFAHIDMDYFYAQAEEIRDPTCLGKVVVVCVYSGRTEDSGVVSSVNYLGRSFGIKAAMPIINAKKLAPNDAIFLPMDRDYYELLSSSVDRIIRSNFYKTIQASIDEWNVEDDLALRKAHSVKDLIKSELGLTCTVGVAPSLLGAKMIAAVSKPNGLQALDEKEEQHFISTSKVIDIPGIGDKTADALSKMNIKIVSDLVKADPISIIEVFGKKTAYWLLDLGRNKYPNELGEEKEQVAISRIGTLKEKTRDLGQLSKKISELEVEAKQWLMHSKKAYRTISVIFISDDMKTHTKSESFKNPKTWESEIVVKHLIEEFLAENPLDVRRIGIRFGNFVDLGGQTTLF